MQENSLIKKVTYCFYFPKLKRGQNNFYQKGLESRTGLNLSVISQIVPCASRIFKRYRALHSWHVSGDPSSIDRQSKEFMSKSLELGHGTTIVAVSLS